MISLEQMTTCLSENRSIEPMYHRLDVWIAIYIEFRIILFSYLLEVESARSSHSCGSAALDLIRPSSSCSCAGVPTV